MVGGVRVGVTYIVRPEERKSDGVGWEERRGKGFVRKGALRSHPCHTFVKVAHPAAVRSAPHNDL
jgi:hypothetical protein